ncbi:hypothetical protein FACS1894186_2350 [Alphaproteobacteria bacterium]|nr:hypothetical protein FACS1894186_2350 [Alphaproteobacteria bacterium]
MAQLNVRIDRELKDSVESIIGGLGLSHSDVVRVLYRQIERHRGLPFALTLDEPSRATQAAMAAFERDLQAGKPAKSYSDSQTLIADMLAD